MKWTNKTLIQNNNNNRMIHCNNCGCLFNLQYTPKFHFVSLVTVFMITWWAPFLQGPLISLKWKSLKSKGNKTKPIPLLLTLYYDIVYKTNIKTMTTHFTFDFLFLKHKNALNEKTIQKSCRYLIKITKTVIKVSRSMYETNYGNL